MRVFSRPTFRCECGRDSSFENRARVMLSEWVIPGKWAPPEARTYACEHCKRENTITKDAAAWREIDQVPRVP